MQSNITPPISHFPQTLKNIDTSEKIAVIDLGSNSARLSIMQIVDGVFCVIVQIKQKVRLAQGLASTNKISQESQARALEAILNFEKYISTEKCDKIIFVATQALREAENAKEVIESIAQTTGLNACVISGIDEAYYDYKGIINTTTQKDFLLLDTGGGSVELVLVIDSKPIELKSLPLGSIVLSERFSQQGDMDASQFFRLSGLIQEQLNIISWLTLAKKLPLIAIGGSNRAIASVFKSQTNDSSPVHGTKITSRALETIYSSLLATRAKERKTILGSASSRYDTIIAGCSPLVFLRRHLMLNEIIVCESGLREGLFFSTIGR